MTEKLFYKDSHLSKFDAEVLSCVRAKRQQVKDSFGRLDGKAGEYYEIELDRTAFFPEGGGQYADTGVLYMADDDTCGLDETARKKVQVLDVRERNGRIFHITDGFIEAKTAVKGSIDWEEYGNSFAVGRGIWRGETDDYETADEVVGALLNKEDSPWKAIEW